MIVIVISDEVTFDDALVVRRLRAQHEILWLRVGDADLTKHESVADVEEFDEVLPAYLREDKAVVTAFHTMEADNLRAFTGALNRARYCL